MASTTGPDLEPGRRAIEALMDDACTITRGDPVRVLDEGTGSLTVDAAAVVYDESSVGSYDGRSLADADTTGGMCAVTVPGAAQPGYRTEGGRQILDDMPTCRIPVDAPDILEGDILTVVSSRRDPHLVGNVYRVALVISSTFAVARRMTLERV